MYPTISEYLEAIKSAEDNFEQLKHLRPVLGADGEPVFSSGNFAVVFKMKDVNTGKLYAVKCFLREQESRAEAYRMIAEELDNVSSSFLTPIKYLDKELFVYSNAGVDMEFPVLLMDWVEGQTLDKYILQNKYDGYKLACLTQEFYELSKWLLSQSFAHGDLKPDNIIVNEYGKLVLVDYDGMYVPKMKGQKIREKGTPNYRNPYFDNDSCGHLFTKRIDDFAIVHILLSLRVYSLLPHLLSSEREFSIFCYDDFYNLSNSFTYQIIVSSNLDVNTSILLSLLQKLLYSGRFNINDLQLLDFTTSVETYYNMEELMCRLDNILVAVNLAYSSMLYKDPARIEYEVNEYKDLSNRINLALEIQDNLKKHEWPFEFYGITFSWLKPKAVGFRTGKAQNLVTYALRYLYGIIKYSAIYNNLPSNIYGGKSDVFTQNVDVKKYESFLNDFVRSLDIASNQNRYMYVFDIKDFFKSVDVSKLKDYFWGTSYTNVEWYDKLFDKLFENTNIHGLNPCSEVDFFFANLYLTSLDEKLMRYDGIKYYRYCDDIRIFSNDNSIQESLNHILENALFPLSLELNQEKTRLIDTKHDRLEMAKACFVISSNIYMETNVKLSLVNNKTLAEIVEHDLTTTYLFKLVNTYGTLEKHLDDLFYIIKTVHKNAALYNKIFELIFKSEIRMGSTQEPMLFSYILNKTVEILYDTDIESFLKYCLLRTFFCTDDHFYKKFFEEEKRWKEQYWYPKPCYMDRMFNIIENKFRKLEYDALLSNLSDYILSVVEPFEKDNNSSNVDDLPF